MLKKILVIILMAGGILMSAVYNFTDIEATTSHILAMQWIMWVMLLPLTTGDW